MKIRAGSISKQDIQCMVQRMVRALEYVKRGSRVLYVPDPEGDLFQYAFCSIAIGQKLDTILWLSLDRRTFDSLRVILSRVQDLGLFEGQTFRVQVPSIRSRYEYDLVIGLSEDTLENFDYSDNGLFYDTKSDLFYEP
jgi:hypothetical protein